MQITVLGMEFEKEMVGTGYKITPILTPSLQEFIDMRKYFLSKGATYDRNDKSFNFTTEPTFDDAPAPVEEVAVATEKTEITEDEKVVDIKTELKKKIAEKKAELATGQRPKNISELPLDEQHEIRKQAFIDDVNRLKEAETANKKEVESLKKGVEFEIYPDASFEECEQFAAATKIALKNRTPEHQTFLDMLLERCKEDADLRRNFVRKDYLNMWSKGGFTFCQREKRMQVNSEGMAGDASAEEILEDVINAYKEPVKTKAATSSTANTKTTSTSKKSTRSSKKTTKKNTKITIK